MKKLFLILAFCSLIICSLIFLSSCSDNAKYLAKHPEICQLCPQPIAHTDTIIHTDTLPPVITDPEDVQPLIDLILFNQDLTCREKIDSILKNMPPKLITKTIIKNITIHDTIPVIDKKAIEKARIEERLKCEKEFASKPKETDWFRWAFFVSCFIIILQFLARFLKK